MHDLVLDAWAIMAWLKGQQPAADRVRTLLEGPVIDDASSR